MRPHGFDWNRVAEFTGSDPYADSRISPPHRGRGFNAIWALDRLVYENPDLLTALEACAAVTSRVRLGTSILLAPLHALLLAKQLATLDLLSNGRMTVGVGIGGRPDDFTGVGVPFAARGARTREAIQIMKQVWTG